MQPTNTDVDYEKALRNYFHYDDEEIHNSAMTVYVSIKHDRPHMAQCIHSKVVEIVKDYTLPDDFYHRKNDQIDVPFYTYDTDAYLLQEFFYDWHEVANGLRRECMTIDRIIDMGENEESDTRDHHTRFTMNTDGIKIANNATY